MNMIPAPKKELKILLLEDEPFDAELVERTLRKASLHFIAERVATRQAFVEALDKAKPDIVLSDYKLPDYDGLSAVKLIKEKYPDLPVIAVSGAIGDEEAVQLIRAGADDYVLKDRLARLPAAVQRALADADIRRRREQAEAALRQSEMRLRESEALYRSVVSAMAEGVVFQAANGAIIKINPAAEKILGTSQELLGQTSATVPWRCIHEDGRPFAPEAHPAMVSLRTGEPLRDVVMGICKSGGRATWISVNSQPLFSEGKTVPYAVVTTFRDITKRKRAEEELRESAAKLREAQRLAGVGSWDWILAGDVHLWSDEQNRIFGRDPSLPPPNFGDYLTYVHPDDRQLVKDSVDGMLKSGAPFDMEYRIVRSDGETRTLKALGRRYEDADGKPIRLGGTVQDITERKRIEERIRAASLYTRSLIEASLDPLVTISPEGKITDVNEATVRATGIARASLIDSDFSSYFTEPEKARAGYQEVYAKGFVTDYPLAIRHVSGAVIDVLYNASLYRDEKGKVAGVFAAARDITERTRIERERSIAHRKLQESEQKLRLALQAGQTGAFDVALDGGRATYTPKIAELWGLPRDFHGDFVSYCWEHVHPEDLPGTKEAFARMAQSREESVMEFRILRPDGELRWIHWEGQVIQDPAGGSMRAVGINMDFTERKQAERDLLRLNRTLRMLSTANGALVRATTEQELLNEMCRIGVETAGYRLAWIGFAEHDETRTVRPVAWAGEHPEYVQSANITWADTERGRGPTGTAVRTGEVQVNQNVETNPAMTPWRTEMLKYGLKASISLPLKNNANIFGALTFYSGDQDAFGPEEVELLKELASDLAYGIHARRDRAGREAALAALQENLKATVQAISTAVEMRDIYTAGHQRHVANLSAAIAREIGLPEGQIEGLFLAGMIHDVGKINVPTELLSKPGRLTPLEYQMIQTHVQSGYEIVKGIKFPWPLGQIILQHHERLDGSGYPNRLKGDALLIESKILAVADVVDAMMSHRPYRPALGLDAALGEIASGKGRLYEPAVVDVCITLFRQKGFKFD